MPFSSKRLLFYASLLGALFFVPAARGAEVPPDIARGERVATAMAHCTECHGADLGGGGRAFPVGRGGANVVPSNLTAGAGGVGGSYSDADFIKAIRLGVRHDGTHLTIMPASDYAFLTAAGRREFDRLHPVETARRSCHHTGRGRCSECALSDGSA